MKKIKLIGCLFVVFTLILGIGLLRKKDDYCYYLAMGDYISHSQVIDGNNIHSFSEMLGEYLLENNKVKEVNGGYLKNNMTSKSLLEMIEKDTYKIDNSNLSKIIKNSKYITISLGINDVINQIKYDSLTDKLMYDEDIISNKIDIFKHNYRQILEDLKDLNKDATILLVGSYRLYNGTSKR